MIFVPSLDNMIVDGSNVTPTTMECVDINESNAYLDESFIPFVLGEQVPNVLQMDTDTSKTDGIDIHGVIRIGYEQTDNEAQYGLHDQSMQNVNNASGLVGGSVDY